VDEVVESQIQLAPRAGEWAALREIGGDDGVPQCQPRCQRPAMGLGEQNRYSSTEAGQLVAV